MGKRRSIQPGEFMSGNAKTYFPGIEHLIHANGDTPAGHVVAGPVQIADGVGRPGLRRDFQHLGMKLLKLAGGQLVLRLIKGQVTVDSNAAETDIHPAQLLNDLVRDVLGGGAEAGTGLCSAYERQASKGTANLTLTYRKCGPYTAPKASRCKRRRRLHWRFEIRAE